MAASQLLSKCMPEGGRGGNLPVMLLRVKMTDGSVPADKKGPGMKLSPPSSVRLRDGGKGNTSRKATMPRQALEH